MIKTYFKTAWRYLLNNKTTTLISIAGLAVGICCFLLLTTYLLNELRYDRFYPNADRIVRVGNNYKTINDNQETNSAVTPTAVVPVFKRQIAGIEDGVRIYNYSGYKPVTVQYKDDLFNEKKVLLADDSFFKIFGFKFLAGNAASALSTPGSLVLTASTAKKYFGNDNPVGKILKVNQTNNMMVTGVIEDVPAYSQIKFDMLGSYSMLDRSKVLKWDSGNDYSYFLLKPGAAATSVQQKMNLYLTDVLKSQQKPGRHAWFTLEKLTDVHLHSSLSNGLEPSGNIKYIYILSFVAVILLVLACINFLNLVTARAAERAHEIGVRKVMGAQRKQLFIQFITEAGLITLASLLIGLALAYLAFPAFSNFAGSQLGLSTWRFTWLAPLLSGLFITVTLLTGAYPALYLSAFKPVTNMKGHGSSKNGNLRKGLVVLQFVVSVFFIICTLIVGHQLRYIQSMDTGINRSQVLVMDIGGMPFNKIETFKNAISTQPGIKSTTASYDSPVQIKGGYTITQAEGKSPDYSLSITGIPVERGFVNTLGIKLLQGSDYTPADEKQVMTDTFANRKYSFIINETAARALGWKPEQAIGKRIGVNGRIGKVKAVTRDFNFASLHKSITPVVLFAEYDWFSKLLIKTSAGNLQNTLTGIKQTWKSFYPNTPFEAHFLDQEFDEMYQNEQRTGGILNIFTAVTVFISCLGLFGLAIFTTKQRFKEVSIRKVLGASVSNIVALVSSDFLKLVFTAIIIASPLAWYAMNRWLQDFAYRITLSWWIFVLSAVLTVLLAFITVSYQTLRAALINPVKGLRSE
ncbi:hypothetical protein BEL04_11895 [Mucilaginibacter sp. PPCGB 2223]|uniref:ABC transporter permease n=1 Tax=Mucilaginibacter sp. PPCGB 2223 TaxID=1886027 RepID=UPI000825664D|nr:ABC transporter permease [Mucilaginibacter sp. PPCGB 2223]OCX52185.1 hypothetical protein BEL04_11895 [Mucilaginibacter sp. PPCGB 2223]